MTAEADAENALTLGQPVTVRLPLSDELIAVVRGHDAGASDAPTLRLTLEGLKTPRAPVSVRVFVNHAGATAETSIDDPHYLGDVGFYPTADYGGGESTLADSSFLLDAGSTLAALAPAERIAGERYVDVTLIAVPLQENAAEAAALVEIPFDSVRLSVHEVEDAPRDDTPADDTPVVN